MFKSVFAEKELQNYLTHFKLNKKAFTRDRLLLGFGLMIAFVLIAIMLDDPALYALAFLGFVGGYKYPYYNLYMRKVNEDELKGYVFPQFLRAFLTLMSTQGNIYQTLRECIPQVDEPIRSKLIELTEKIETNNDYMHYWEFAEFIGTTEAQMVMSMIHGFSESGARKEELEELERMIEDIQVNKMAVVIRQKASQQERYTGYPILLTVGFVLVFAATVLVQNITKFASNLSIGG